MPCVGVSGTEENGKKESCSGVEEVYTSMWPYISALKFMVPSLS